MRQRYDGTVKSRVQELADAWGWPRYVIKHRATELGLARSGHRRAWTPDEDEFLEQEVGRRTLIWLSRRMERSVSSIVNRIKRLRISRRQHDGWYTASELAECIGHDPGTVIRWIEKGWLAAEHRGTTSHADPWVIVEASVREFIRRHPLVFDLRKVDQLWFIDLLGGVQQ